MKPGVSQTAAQMLQKLLQNKPGTSKMEPPRKSTDLFIDFGSMLGAFSDSFWLQNLSEMQSKTIQQTIPKEVTSLMKKRIQLWELLGQLQQIKLTLR